MKDQEQFCVTQIGLALFILLALASIPVETFITNLLSRRRRKP
jgi:hypothetical protein